MDRFYSDEMKKCALYIVYYQIENKGETNTLNSYVGALMTVF